MSDDSKKMAFSLPRNHIPLYPNLTNENGVWVSMMHKILADKAGKSGQSVRTGTRPHPYDFAALKTLQDYNEHHATCIHAKVAATVGLGCLNDAEKQERQQAQMPMTLDPNGMPAQNPVVMPLYQESKVDTVLNPLTSISWQDTLTDACEDYHETGNGYIEVVRSGGVIKGLHHLASTDVRVHVEDANYNFHYELTGEDAYGTRRFPAFGDADDFFARASGNGYTVQKGADAQNISEVIHFRRPSSRDRFYGRPDWISAVPMIELVQMLHQFKFDYFNNRGVPEFMLFLLGAAAGDKEFTALENSLKANIGYGNSHKSTVVNFPSPNMTIQLEKLAMESKGEDDFKALKETAALSIVTAHKVPPLLAGIQIPGKLGATNELSQALIAFQSLVVGQDQRLFQMTLARTLGSPEAGLGLTGEDFTFKTITDDLDPAKMDTIGRMHQPLPQANAEGRDVEEGVRD